MDREDLKYYLKQLSKPLSVAFLGIGFGLILIIVFLLWFIATRSNSQPVSPTSTPSSTPVVSTLPGQPVKEASALPLIYIVNRGDSSWRIAEAFWGDGRMYTLIEKANHLPADAWLEVGQELLIPDPQTFQPAELKSGSYQISDPQADLTSSPSSESGQFAYTVEPNDSLWFIALKYLGEGSRWVEIYQLNQNQIAHPDLIYPGQVFAVPEN